MCEDRDLPVESGGKLGKKAGALGSDAERIEYCLLVNYSDSCHGRHSVIVIVGANVREPFIWSVGGSWWVSHI